MVSILCAKAAVINNLTTLLDLVTLHNVQGFISWRWIPLKNFTVF